MADKTDKTYKITMSERCFRFKPDALPPHAPPLPGVYEFVTFDAEMKPIVLFVGMTGEKTIYDQLAAHMTGKAEPTAAALFGEAKDVYFDYVMPKQGDSPEDMKDIAGALIAKGKPKFNTGDAPTSGRYTAVTLEEVG